MGKRFLRRIEDFVCEHCGHKTKGSGYTNHCPKCLWSKHVDINPGDRMSTCLGLMEPVEVQTKKGKYVIVHRCLKCNLKKRNKMAENDNFNEIVRIASLNIKGGLK